MGEYSWGILFQMRIFEKGKASFAEMREGNRFLNSPSANTLRLDEAESPPVLILRSKMNHDKSDVTNLLAKSDLFRILDQVAQVIIMHVYNSNGFR